MAQLSDSIERFIKDMMEDGAQIEVRRNELAQHFGCAPSQINYVLATRFSVDHGYIIESRRGGGGYIRIVRMGVNSPETCSAPFCSALAIPSTRTAPWPSSRICWIAGW